MILNYRDGNETNYWIGLSDGIAEGTFRWTSGEVLGTYNDWRYDSPSCLLISISITNIRQC